MKIKSLFLLMLGISILSLNLKKANGKDLYAPRETLI